MSGVGGEADENRAEADIMRQRSPRALSPICRADALCRPQPDKIRSLNVGQRLAHHHASAAAITR